MGDWPKGTVQGNGLEICYHRTGGDKPALVLAHGFSDNGLCWRRTANVLQTDFDVVMFDARNHGETDRGEIAPDVMANDCIALIESLELDQPILMGHSMGGRTVAQVAGMRPDLVSQAILEDPPWSNGISDNPEEAAKRSKQFRTWLASMAGKSIEDIERMGRAVTPNWHDEDFPDWAVSKQQLDADAMKGLSWGDWRDDAKAIGVPTLLIYADSESGGIVSAEIAAEAATLNPHITTRQVSPAGHNIRRENFDSYIAAVTDYLGL